MESEFSVNSPLGRAQTPELKVIYSLSVTKRNGCAKGGTAASLEANGEQRELLYRVTGSQVFQKSNRLREFLLFVGERALLDPNVHVREQDIGVEVFGRPAGYDTSQDTLVRVQASQLRKKLQQYFAEDGKDEPMVIELPKGGYLPLFKTRPALPPMESEAQLQHPQRWLPWTTAAVLAVVCGILLFQNAGLRRRAEFGTGASPLAHRFWRQVLGNGLNNYVVLSDGNLVVFEDAIARHVSVQEYENRVFELLATQNIEDPVKRALILSVSNRVYTGQADVSVARRLSLIGAANRLRLDVVNAREMSASQISAYNTILLGSRRANPWVSLYEEQMNYRAGFEESPRLAYFTNRSPNPGEPREYRGRFGSLGFCRVAFLPNKDGGSAILITGTDMASSEAGGEFLTSDTWLRVLRRALGLREDEPFPHFEAVLRCQVVNNSAPQFQFVTARRR